GCIVPADGEAILLIGPESKEYAEDHSMLPTIRTMIAYRESAEPDYPELSVSTFGDVFDEALGGRPLHTLGLVGYSIMPLPVYDGVRAAFPGVELVKADEIIIKQRVIKSPAELEVMREAFRMSEHALEAVVSHIRAGMTELELVGLIQKELYAAGAEYEAHAVYAFAGPRTRHAISRPTHSPIMPGTMIQLNLGARLAGYSPSVGRPLCIGPMPAEMRALVEVGRDAHYQTMAWMRAGVIASDVVSRFYDYIRSRGFGDHLLYGPCHGLGMMEVERPWMESTTHYPLEENMTFQVDTFLQTPAFGLRWENGVRVAADGVETLSDALMDIMELPL
ncbi:MAG TPA: M24 family metallopeptidase, partial [Armatimonadota bacterium]|nr:M24 family metallopeptidase [Armatimonadota bacterium]